MSRKNKNKQIEANIYGNGNQINNNTQVKSGNQVDKSTNVYYNIVNEVKPTDSLDNMSDREGLEVRYKVDRDNKIKVDEKAIIHVQGYAVKYTNLNPENSIYTHKSCIRLLVINIHQQVLQGWQYKCDHIHLSVPDDLVDESLEGRLLNIKGFVYPYAKDKKRSIEAIDIKIVRDEFDKVDEPQRIRPCRNFNFNINKLDGEYETYLINKFKKMYSKLTEVERISFLNKSKYLLELCLDGNFYNEFINNYIVTQYTCNYSPSLVRELSHDVLLRHYKASADVTIIVSALVYDMVSKDITTLPQLFERITGYINWGLGLNKDNIRGDESETRLDNDESLVTFKNKMSYISETLDKVSAYRFAKLKIQNFGEHFDVGDEIIAKAADVLCSPDFESITRDII